MLTSLFPVFLYIFTRDRCVSLLLKRSKKFPRILQLRIFVRSVPRTVFDIEREFFDAVVRQHKVDVFHSRRMNIFQTVKKKISSRKENYFTWRLDKELKRFVSTEKGVKIFNKNEIMSRHCVPKRSAKEIPNESSRKVFKQRRGYVDRSTSHVRKVKHSSIQIWINEWFTYISASG